MNVRYGCFEENKIDFQKSIWIKKFLTFSFYAEYHTFSRNIVCR